MIRLTDGPLEREELFWSQIKVGKENECWPWIGRKDKDGYGSFRWNGPHVRVHRLAFFLHYGVDPFPLLVCHSCDNPPCANPVHLNPGNQQLNVLDSIQKGRWNHPKGADHYASKLSVKQVLHVRTSNEFGTVLAKRFGVCPQAINNIRRNKSWKGASRS